MRSQAKMLNTLFSVEYWISLMTGVILFGVLMLTMVNGAAAQTGELIGENGAWKSYRSGKGNSAICFVTSQPTKYEGKYDRNNRGETRVFVTHHGRDPENRGVVSNVAGYKYMPDREVTFNIDGKTFSLFSVDTRAWATKPSQDRDLVKAMKRGNKLKVTGVSSRGNKTIDTYSLKGFTAAMKKIDKACS